MPTLFFTGSMFLNDELTCFDRLQIIDFSQIAVYADII